MRNPKTYLEWRLFWGALFLFLLCFAHARCDEDAPGGGLLPMVQAVGVTLNGLAVFRICARRWPAVAVYGPLGVRWLLRFLGVLFLFAYAGMVVGLMAVGMFGLAGVRADIMSVVPFAVLLMSAVLALCLLFRWVRADLATLRSGRAVT